MREIKLGEKIDWVGMSPLGNWVLIGALSGTGTINGLMIASKDLQDTGLHKLAKETKHSDVGLYIDGNDTKEVVVTQNESPDDYIDMFTLPSSWPSNQPDYKVSPRHLVRLFYSSDISHSLNEKTGVHISCNANGYALVSTYTPNKLGDEKNWLERSIILVKLDPTLMLDPTKAPEAFYLAKIHNTKGECCTNEKNECTGCYWEETQATITNDGTSVVWVANFNKDIELETVYMLRLDL